MESVAGLKTWVNSVSLFVSLCVDLSVVEHDVCKRFIVSGSVCVGEGERRIQGGCLQAKIK